MGNNDCVEDDNQYMIPQNAVNGVSVLVDVHIGTQTLDGSAFAYSCVH